MNKCLCYFLILTSPVNFFAATYILIDYLYINYETLDEDIRTFRFWYETILCGIFVLSSLYDFIEQELCYKR